MPNRRLIRIREVIALSGKSRSSVYSDPTFPKPIRIGERAVAWFEDEVAAWRAEREAARERDADV